MVVFWRGGWQRATILHCGHCWVVVHHSTAAAKVPRGMEALTGKAHDQGLRGQHAALNPQTSGAQLASAKAIIEVKGCVWMCLWVGQGLTRPHSGHSWVVVHYSTAAAKGRGTQDASRQLHEWKLTGQHGVLLSRTTWAYKPWIWGYLSKGEGARSHGWWVWCGRYCVQWRGSD